MFFKKKKSLNKIILNSLQLDKRTNAMFNEMSKRFGVRLYDDKNSDVTKILDMFIKVDGQDDFY